MIEALLLLASLWVVVAGAFASDLFAEVLAERKASGLSASDVAVSLLAAMVVSLAWPAIAAQAIWHTASARLRRRPR